MKLDPYKHKEQYLKWKEDIKGKGIVGISKYNSSILIQYLENMENSINISSSSPKGRIIKKIREDHILLNISA